MKVIRLKNSAADRVHKLGCEFGFTPASRPDVKTSGGNDQPRVSSFARNRDAM
jgi:phage terminase small subunit